MTKTRVFQTHYRIHLDIKLSALDAAFAIFVGIIFPRGSVVGHVSESATHNI